MRRFRSAACAAVLLASFGACTTEAPNARHEELWVEPGSECQIQYTPLKSGTEYRGAVDVINTGTDLIVEVRRSDDWMIESATLYLGTGYKPTSAWMLPFQHEFTGGPVEVTTFTIPLTDLASCGDELWLGVSAVVVRGYERETAWAKDPDCPPGTSTEGQTFSYEICCEPKDGDKGCVRTQGYWKRHPYDWPVWELEIGGVTYSKGDLIDLLEMSPKGDASLILLKQLVAAMLNAESGAAVPWEVQDAIDDAQEWMANNKDGDGELPYGVHASSSAGQEAIDIKDVLVEYNEGRAGVPSCR